MGKAKLKMELGTSETERNLAFKNKKESLIKRMHDFTVLSEAKACMIRYYGSKKESLIWPENLDEVQGLVDAYKNKDQSGRNKQAKYPTWHESLDHLTGPELIGFAQALGDKAALVKSRIDQLKRHGQGLDTHSTTHELQHTTHITTDQNKSSSIS